MQTSRTPYELVYRSARVGALGIDGDGESLTLDFRPDASEAADT